MCNDHIGEQCYRSLSARSSISPVILGTQQYQTPLPISLDINWHTPTACADPEKCSRGKDKCALTVHEPLPNHCSSTTPPPSPMLLPSYYIWSIINVFVLQHISSHLSAPPPLHPQCQVWMSHQSESTSLHLAPSMYVPSAHFVEFKISLLFIELT